MIDFEDFPHGADKSLTFPTPPKKTAQTMKGLEHRQRSSVIYCLTTSRWWFQIFFFSPLFGEDSHFD